VTRRRTFYEQPAVLAGPPRERATGELGTKIQAAVAAGLAWFTFFDSLALLIAGMGGNLNTGTALNVSGWVALTALVFTALLLLSWSVTVAERDWRIDDQERKRRWAMEDEERRRQAALTEQLAQGHEEPVPADLRVVPMTCFGILHRHFAGLPTTREECVAARICSQGDWNLANRVLVELGMKSGYTLDPGPSLMDAWNEWQRRVEVRERDVWVWNEDRTKSKAVTP